MYKSGQQVLSKGLSPFSKILLGLVTMLFGVLMILIAPDMSKPLAILSFGLFCLAISVMCFTKGKIRNYLGRLIGLITFCFSILYFFEQLNDGVFFSGSRSQPSLFNSVLFFLAFGFPGIWFAVKGQFPIQNKKETHEKV